MLAFHESLVLVVVGIGAILAGNLAPVGPLNKLGDKIIFIFWRVDERSTHLHPHSIELFRMNSTANPIPAFEEEVGDVVFREGLGSTDA